MPEVSPSILIIRLDAIGDALALTPLLAALAARAIPTDVVLGEASAGIFSSRAARSIAIADFQLRSNSRANRTAIDRFGHRLAGNGYSHVLVATEDPGGYRLAKAIGAPTRIGYADPVGKPFKSLWAKRLLTATIYRTAGLDRRAPHECQVLFELGRSLLADQRPTVDIAQLRPLVIENEPAANDCIAVQITEKWERLGVGLADVVALVRRLLAHGPPNLLAARREAVYARRIEEATGLNVTFFDTVEPWKDAIAAARALVAPDSGAMHVAGMIGTPVVGVFPPSKNFELQVARWAPWAAPHRIVRAGENWPIRCESTLTELLST